MSRRQGPAKRLLVLPALLVVGLLVLVHAVRAAGPPPADDELAVADVPPVAAQVTRCSRDDPAATLGRIREEIDLRGRVTSELVHACPTVFDGLEVHYAGELVGDLLHREGGAWVMVNDDDYALETGPLATHRDPRGMNSGLNVWLPDGLHDRITGLGAPNRRGDVVHLVGRIHRTDPRDGGGLTLRAQQLTVLAPATEIDEPVDLPQAALASAALAAGAVLWGVRRRSRPGPPRP